MPEKYPEEHCRSRKEVEKWFEEEEIEGAIPRDGVKSATSVQSPSPPKIQNLKKKSLPMDLAFLLAFLLQESGPKKAI